MDLTAVWLRRKRALAYTMAGALLTFVTLLAFAVMSLISAGVLA